MTPEIGLWGAWPKRSCKTGSWECPHLRFLSRFANYNTITVSKEADLTDDLKEFGLCATEIVDIFTKRCIHLAG
jgi:hypothetical protein